MSEMQVHLAEARVSSALDKLARMETLVNDRLLPPDGGSSTSAAEPTSLLPPSTSTTARVRAKKQAHRALDVSGPVKPYNPSLKNFWYPVAFSSDLKEDTMVNSVNKSFKPIYSLSKQSRTGMCLSE
jgi:chlorophyllide a oxygenase